MIAKSGDPLLLPNAINILKEKLMPLCTVVTPNLPEAHKLTNDSEEIETMAHHILKSGCKSVLIKGGHATADHSNDLFVDALGTTYWIESKRIKSKNVHGTGCTLSSAICAFMAHGFSERMACIHAKQLYF